MTLNVCSIKLYICFNKTLAFKQILTPWQLKYARENKYWVSQVAYFSTHAKAALPKTLLTKKIKMIKYWNNIEINCFLPKLKKLQNSTRVTTCNMAIAIVHHWTICELYGKMTFHEWPTAISLYIISLEVCMYSLNDHQNTRSTLLTMMCQLQNN